LGGFGCSEIEMFGLPAVFNKIFISHLLNTKRTLNAAHFQELDLMIVSDLFLAISLHLTANKHSANKLRENNKRFELFKINL